jgi:predicted GIY-YIG superfamily endonuclease
MSSNLVLYRFFDADGGLLYIGVSMNVWARFSQHRQGSAFFPDAASVTMQGGFSSRAKLLVAERTAIRREKPRFNVVHNRPKPKPKSASRSEAAWARVHESWAEVEAWAAESPDNEREMWEMINAIGRVHGK